MSVLLASRLSVILCSSLFFWRGAGRRVFPTPPTLTQLQLPSFLKRSPQEPEHSDDEGDVSEGRKENTVRNSFGEHFEGESLQSDEDKVLESGDVEDASNKGEQNVGDGEKQTLNDTSGDEPQHTASLPALKPSISPQEQEKSSDGAKDESQNPEPAAKSKSVQVDSKSTSDSSKDEPRLSVAESAPESKNSRQDTEKTQKGGSDEPQRTSSQPRKPRKSQRNKRKFSGLFPEQILALYLWLRDCFQVVPFLLSSY